MMVFLVIVPPNKNDGIMLIPIHMGYFLLKMFLPPSRFLIFFNTVFGPFSEKLEEFDNIAKVFIGNYQ